MLNEMILADPVFLFLWHYIINSDGKRGTFVLPTNTNLELDELISQRFIKLITSDRNKIKTWVKDFCCAEYAH